MQMTWVCLPLPASVYLCLPLSTSASGSASAWQLTHFWANKFAIDAEMCKFYSSNNKTATTTSAITIILLEKNKHDYSSGAAAAAAVAVAVRKLQHFVHWTRKCSSQIVIIIIAVCFPAKIMCAKLSVVAVVVVLLFVFRFWQIFLWICAATTC